jgi:hypothetical protein
MTLLSEVERRAMLDGNSMLPGSLLKMQTGERCRIEKERARGI